MATGDLQDWTLQQDVNFVNYIREAQLTTIVYTTKLNHVLPHQTNKLNPPTICYFPFQTNTGHYDEKDYLC